MHAIINLFDTRFDTLKGSCVSNIEHFLIKGIIMPLIKKRKELKPEYRIPDSVNELEQLTAIATQKNFPHFQF